MVGIVIIFFSLLFAGSPLPGKDLVAVFWGQNSAGTQTALRDYCTKDVDIIVLQYLYQFGMAQDLKLNFTTSTDLEAVGDDITYCQSLGKQVLLSLGGPGENYGFAGEGNGSDALGVAHNLYSKFGGGPGLHPFGDALIDGYDINFRTGKLVGYAQFVNELLAGNPDLVISVTPNCKFPDPIEPVLEAAPFDYAFVQFFNDACEPGPNFNFDDWDKFTGSLSKNKDIKIFLGLPAGPTAADTGYQEPDALREVIDAAQRTGGSFGGVALYDASEAFTNVAGGTNYAQLAKSILTSQ